VLWGPFPSVNHYDDSLRRYLRCSINGRRAITAIVGEIEVLKCQEKNRESRCTWLKNHLADEILAETDELEAREERLRGAARKADYAD
jgi:hypothetical protein